MTILLGRHLIRCVLLTEGRCLEFLPFLGFHAEAALAIEVNMFIILGKCSDACESGNVLKESNTSMEVAPRDLGLKDIPPKPPDKAVDLIVIVHSIHF